MLEVFYDQKCKTVFQLKPIIVIADESLPLMKVAKSDFSKSIALAVMICGGKVLPILYKNPLFQKLQERGT